jgi:hypothetical protein
MGEMSSRYKEAGRVPGDRSAADIELHTGYCFVAGGRRKRCQRVLIPTSGPTTMRDEMHATYRERRSRICRCIVPTGRSEFKIASERVYFRGGPTRACSVDQPVSPC